LKLNKIFAGLNVLILRHDSAQSTCLSRQLVTFQLPSSTTANGRKI